MIKGFQVTLYEVFGYFIPGCFLFSAIAILYWSLLAPTYVVRPHQFSAQEVVVFAVVAYFLGHFAQAIGNNLSKLLVNCFDRKWVPRFVRNNVRTPEKALLSEDSPESAPSEFRQAALNKLRKFAMLPEPHILTEGAPPEIGPLWLYKACDEAVVQRGKLGDREIFVYREGFYRGMWVALLLLSIALCVRACSPGGIVEFEKQQVALTRHHSLFLVSVSLAGSLAAYYRYVRFGRYRVSQALFGFLALPEEKKKDAKEKKDEEKADDD